MGDKKDYNELLRILKNMGIDIEENKVMYRFLENKFNETNGNQGQLFFTANAIKMISDIEAKLNKVN